MQHIAIDLGGKESQICVRDSSGHIVEERRESTPRLRRFLEGREKARVIVETCSEAFVVADAARAAGHEVRVVPSTLARSLGVGARRIKTDRRDARALSEVSCRVELPSVHVPSTQARERKAACAMREAIVAGRTAHINQVRSWMRTQGISVRGRGTTTFARRVRETLLARGEGLPQYIERVLVLIEAHSAQLAEADAEMRRMAQQDAVCERLMSVPGVGPVTAVRFCAAIDQPERFADAHQLESYLGLTPGESSSSERTCRTAITKAGAAPVRRVLVQAAWSAWRCRPSDPMVLWARALSERRGRQVAIVALARKLAGILYALWRDGTRYLPHRAADSSAARR